VRQSIWTVQTIICILHMATIQQCSFDLAFYSSPCKARNTEIIFFCCFTLDFRECFVCNLKQSTIQKLTDKIMILAKPSVVLRWHRCLIVFFFASFNMVVVLASKLTPLSEKSDRTYIIKLFWRPSRVDENTVGLSWFKIYRKLS
jgi:hypothetical protein